MTPQPIKPVADLPGLPKVIGDLPKLVSDGLALTYAAPEAAKLPDGTVWQNQAYGTTLEPFALVFNKRALPPEG